MKKFFSLVIATMFALTINAQEHLTFKGVAIDGNLSSFMKELTAKGFVSVGVQDGTGMMTGKLINQDVTAIIYTSPATKKVFSVVAVFEGGSQWSLIEAQYSSLKEMLIQKYGEPQSCIERSSDAYATNMLHELLMDRLTYQTDFVVPNGTIILKIMHERSLGNVIMLAYKDSANENSTKDEYIDEL